jgi:resuscitation-promoting factor RpfA
MDKSKEAFRTISEVAAWLETPAHVLRFWESRFTQIKPVKRAGGRRYYRPADMRLLGGIKKLLHENGMTIRGVQKLLREEGVKYVSALSTPLDPDLESAAKAVPEAPMAEDVPAEPAMDNVVVMQRPGQENLAATEPGQEPPDDSMPPSETSVGIEVSDPGAAELSYDLSNATGIPPVSDNSLAPVDPEVQPGFVPPPSPLPESKPEFDGTALADAAPADAAPDDVKPGHAAQGDAAPDTSAWAAAGVPDQSDMDLTPAPLVPTEETAAPAQPDSAGESADQENGILALEPGAPLFDAAALPETEPVAAEGESPPPVEAPEPVSAPDARDTPVEAPLQPAAEANAADGIPTPAPEMAAADADSVADSGPELTGFGAFDPDPGARADAAADDTPAVFAPEVPDPAIDLPGIEPAAVEAPFSEADFPQPEVLIPDSAPEVTTAPVAAPAPAPAAGSNLPHLALATSTGDADQADPLDEDLSFATGPGVLASLRRKPDLSASRPQVTAIYHRLRTLRERL